MRVIKNRQLFKQDKRKKHLYVQNKGVWLQDTQTKNAMVY